MKIIEHIEDNAPVLTIEGKMMGDPETFNVHERVKGLVKRGFKNVIIDLKPLEWLNSAGLGTLIASMITLRKSGGELFLVNVDGKAREVISMTHLDQVFCEYASLDLALKALGGGNKA